MKKINISVETKNELKEILDFYETYADFCRDMNNAYKYVKRFNIKICPYCNIHYINPTFDENCKEKNNSTCKNKNDENKKYITRPPLDHFVPKSENSQKQLSVDNLVPCCPECNLIKGDRYDEKNPILHPILDKKDFDQIKRFKIVIKNDPKKELSLDYIEKNNFENNFKIDFENIPGNLEEDYRKGDKTINLFYLTERYQHHMDIVESILKKIKLYPQSKIKELEKIVPFTEETIFRDANCDIHKTSLGKLKRDIIARYRRIVNSSANENTDEG